MALADQARMPAMQTQPTLSAPATVSKGKPQQPSKGQANGVTAPAAMEGLHAGNSKQLVVSASAEIAVPSNDRTNSPIERSKQQIAPTVKQPSSQLPAVDGKGPCAGKGKPDISLKGRSRKRHSSSSGTPSSTTSSSSSDTSSGTTSTTTSTSSSSSDDTSSSSRSSSHHSKDTRRTNRHAASRRSRSRSRSHCRSYRKSHSRSRSRSRHRHRSRTSGRSRARNSSRGRSRNRSRSRTRNRSRSRSRSRSRTRNRSRSRSTSRRRNRSRSRSRSLHVGSSRTCDRRYSSARIISQDGRHQPKGNSAHLNSSRRCNDLLLQQGGMSRPRDRQGSRPSHPYDFTSSSFKHRGRDARRSSSRSRVQRLPGDRWHRVGRSISRSPVRQPRQQQQHRRRSRSRSTHREGRRSLSPAHHSVLTRLGNIASGQHRDDSRVHASSSARGYSRQRGQAEHQQQQRPDPAVERRGSVFDRLSVPLQAQERQQQQQQREAERQGQQHAAVPVRATHATLVRRDDAEACTPIAAAHASSHANSTANKSRAGTVADRDGCPVSAVVKGNLEVAALTPKGSEQQQQHEVGNTDTAAVQRSTVPNVKDSAGQAVAEGRQMRLQCEASRTPLSVRAADGLRGGPPATTFKEPPRPVTGNNSTPSTNRREQVQPRAPDAAAPATVQQQPSRAVDVLKNAAVVTKGAGQSGVPARAAFDQQQQCSRDSHRGSEPRGSDKLQKQNADSRPEGEAASVVAPAARQTKDSKGKEPPAATPSAAHEPAVRHSRDLGGQQQEQRGAAVEPGHAHGHVKRSSKEPATAVGKECSQWPRASSQEQQRPGHHRSVSPGSAAPCNDSKQHQQQAAREQADESEQQATHRATSHAGHRNMMHPAQHSSDRQVDRPDGRTGQGDGDADGNSTGCDVRGRSRCHDGRFTDGRSSGRPTRSHERQGSCRDDKQQQQQQGTADRHDETSQQHSQVDQQQQVQAISSRQLVQQDKKQEADEENAGQQQHQCSQGSKGAAAQQGRPKPQDSGTSPVQQQQHQVQQQADGSKHAGTASPHGSQPHGAASPSGSSKPARPGLVIKIGAGRNFMQSPSPAAAAAATVSAPSHHTVTPAAAAANRSQTPAPAACKQLVSPSSSISHHQQQQQQQWSCQQWQQQVVDPAQEKLAAAEQLVVEAMAQCHAGLQPVMAAYNQFKHAKQELADEQACTHRFMQRAVERCWAFALQQSDGVLVWDNGPDEELYTLQEIQQMFPTGFDIDGRFVQLCFDGGEALDLPEPPFSHPTWPPLSSSDQEWPWDSQERLSHWQMMSLAEAQQLCSTQAAAQELQQELQEVQQQLDKLLEAMAQLRTAVHNLALSSAAQQSARLTCHPWLWLNGPWQLPYSSSSSSRAVSWKQLQQMVSDQCAGQRYDPSQISIQQHVPGVRTPRTNLLRVQQQLAAAEAHLVALRAGFLDSNMILSELPPFEDCTACWLLTSHTAAAGAAVSIDQMRLCIHQQTLSPFQVAAHVSDSSRLVWVLDLVMLRVVDQNYEDMQQEQDLQQQQQHDHHQFYQRHQQQPWQAAALLHSPRQQQATMQQRELQSPRQGLHQQLLPALPASQPPPPPPPAAAAATKATPSPEGPPAPPTPPVDEPAASAAAAAAVNMAASPAATVAASESPMRPWLNHAPRSVVAVTFPAMASTPFVWPRRAWRARRLLRRFFGGCDDLWEALPTDDDDDDEAAVQLVAAAAAGSEAARPAVAVDQQHIDVAIQQQEQQHQEPPCVSPDTAAAIQGTSCAVSSSEAVANPTADAVSAAAQAEPVSSSNKQKGRGGRKRQRAACAAVDSFIAGLDPETAAAVREAMYGVRKSSRSSERKQQQPWCRRGSLGPAAADSEGSKQPRSRSATPTAAEDSEGLAASSSAVSTRLSPAATDSAMPVPVVTIQDQLQALNRADIDAATKAAIQAAVLGLRRPRGSQQQHSTGGQGAAAAAVGADGGTGAQCSDTKPGSAKQRQQAGAKRAGPACSSKAAAAVSRPAKKARKVNASAAAGSVRVCARSMTVQQVRTAAARSKQPGFSQGLCRGVAARQKLSDAQEAIADLPRDEQGFYLPMPHSLPLCLLNYDPTWDPNKQQATGASSRSRLGRSSRAGGSSRDAPAAAAVAAGSSTSNRRERSQMRTLMRAADVGQSEAVKWKNLVAKSKKVVFQRSGVHGWGLFAGEEIAADDFVIEYVGELIRPVLEDIRERHYESQGQDSSYLFRIDKEWVADATVRGGLARFINHSCDPNCYTKIFEMEGTRKIGIYAKKSIAQGQELAYDYKFEFEEGERKVPCACGAKNCRGFMN